MKARENASTALLNYGFTFYDTKLVVKGGAVLATARVWKAQNPSVDLASRTISTLRCRAVKPASRRPPMFNTIDRTACPRYDRRHFARVAGTQTLATLPLHPLKKRVRGRLVASIDRTIRLWFA